MIRNERQYRITRAQLEEFERKLEHMAEAPPDARIHPRIRQAQLDAVRSQEQELREELTAYEALRDKRSRVIELSSLDELPSALIQARIAAGLTQRELADRLGMKEQQLQRYEATDYAGASLDRIRQVVAALGVAVREEVFLPHADVTMARLLKRTASAGLAKDFVSKRILSPAPKEETAVVLSAASILNRIFGWAPATLLGDSPLTLSTAALAGARFKLPVKSATPSTEAYAIYAHYLAGLLIRATPTLTQSPFPTDPAVFRREVLARGPFSFENVLDYIWSLGIAVLPLADPGAFHGAAWRISGRNVVALKQGTRFESRWLYDLLHEARHTAEEPSETELAFIDYEQLAKEDASEPAETEASSFAGNALLDGRAEELAEKCAERASGSIERLKSVVPKVAAEANVPPAALANYMAFRLSLQGASWWGAATNLQTGTVDPWLAARESTLRRLDLKGLDDVERTTLLRALDGGAG